MSAERLVFCLFTDDPNLEPRFAEIALSTVWPAKRRGAQRFAELLIPRIRAATRLVLRSRFLPPAVVPDHLMLLAARCSSANRLKVPNLRSELIVARAIRSTITIPDTHAKEVTVPLLTSEWPTISGLQPPFDRFRADQMVQVLEELSPATAPFIGLTRS